MKRMEKTCQYVKSKQLPFIENFTCLEILSADSVYYTFSEMYLSYSLNFDANKKQLLEEKYL